jgi:hypothetical protein
MPINVVGRTATWTARSTVKQLFPKRNGNHHVMRRNAKQLIPRFLFNRRRQVFKHVGGQDQVKRPISKGNSGCVSHHRFKVAARQGLLTRIETHYLLLGFLDQMTGNLSIPTTNIKQHCLYHSARNR